jgi:regulator of sigma E protease
MSDVLQNILIYAGSFVLVLSVVVFVHEFGHFQVARWRGVAIDTFSIGFGKTLLGWRDRQGVQWKVRRRCGRHVVRAARKDRRSGGAG